MSRKSSLSSLPFIFLLLAMQLVSGCAGSLFKDRTAEPLDAVDTARRVDGELEKSYVDRMTGKNLAADIPYARNLPWVGAAEPSEQKARVHFAGGQQKYQNKEYSAARKSFEKAASLFPDSPLHEDASFLIAETYFFEDEYPEAFKGYETLVNKYKRSRHLDTVVARQFAIGQYWQSRHQESPKSLFTPNLTDKKVPFNDIRGRALRAFEKVRLNHPTGPLADDSLMATAGSMFVKGQYEDADYFYTLLRREYPNSDHQYQAHLLGIQAKIRSYQGPQYDGTVLEEAKELIRQSLKQFREMPQEDRQRLQELYAQVITNLAARDYEMARFYEVKEYNGAAKIYYERVTREFPQTSVAAKARERLAELDGKPSAPAPRFTWISSLFPDEKKNLLQLESGTPSGTIQR